MDNPHSIPRNPFDAFLPGTLSSADRFSLSFAAGSPWPPRRCLRRLVRPRRVSERRSPDLRPSSSLSWRRSRCHGTMPVRSVPVRMIQGERLFDVASRCSSAFRCRGGNDAATPAAGRVAAALSFPLRRLVLPLLGSAGGGGGEESSFPEMLSDGCSILISSKISSVYF